MKHVTDLTCCRALFAGWVFAYHLNLQAHYAGELGAVGGLVARGSLGVDGFFILSGMVLAYAHPDLAPNLAESRRFWAKRLVRIYPVHLATIALMAALLGGAWLLHVHPRDPDRFGVGELFSNLALLHAWGASDRWAWNYPSWSISAEWAGYLVFPLLWALLRGQNGIGLMVVLPLTLLGVGGAYAWGHAHDLSLTYDGGLVRFFPEFIAGIAILPLLAHLGARFDWRWAALLAGAAAVGCAMRGAEVATIAALWAMLAALLAAGVQGRPAVLGRIPGMRWLGEVSYAFYMSFALVETFQATLWRRLALAPAEHQLLYVTSTALLTLGLATLLWALVEQPALRAFARATRRPAAPARVSTPAGLAG